jgi:hypothetical protein
LWVPATENFASQCADPFDRRASHSFLPPAENVTDPFGVLPDDVTVADSRTLAPTLAVFGFADTVVCEACFLAALAAGAAG